MGWFRVLGDLIAGGGGEIGKIRDLGPRVLAEDLGLELEIFLTNQLLLLETYLLLEKVNVVLGAEE